MAERNFWFVPRPLRDPQYHSDGLRALERVTDGFKLKWKGNRPLQRKYEQYLAGVKMKRAHISKDGSGGRTWAAMFRMYNYIYQDEEGFLHPTKVTNSILKGTKTFENVKKQILTLQIPNSYFLNARFYPKYSDGYHIQPIIFLIKLANSDILNKYIDIDEIILFAMTAKKDDELQEKINEIIEYRKLNDGAKKRMKLEILKNNGDISRKDSKPDYSKYKDVATTFTVLCNFTGYAIQNRGKLRGINDPQKWKEFQEFCVKYPFNDRINTDLLLYTLNAGLDVDTHKAQYGVSGKVASQSRKKEVKVQRLLEDYPQPEELTINELTQILNREFADRDARKIAEEIRSRKFTIKFDSFINSYIKENDDREFERKTERIFERLGLDTEMHPKPTAEFNNSNENIDIIAKSGDNLVLIDSKNYAKKFSLSSSLRNVMANSYLAGYKGFKGLMPKYYCYVTANVNSNESNLKKINELAQKNSELSVHGMMISATALCCFLNYCFENGIDKSERIKMFLSLFQDKSYNNFGQVASALRLNL